ncbi:MAG TPA: sensor domain-containing diguanylate cyclase, partial [Kofleriaceae bacterium]|nr:sensor domain-containing diguanylate cyclase [Kofleriaceae bacterium]
MADQRPAPPRPERLLAIIELQNAIAAAGMNADEVMDLVVERAATLLSASSATVAISEGDDLVVRAVSRTSGAPRPARLPRPGGAGLCFAERRPIPIGDVACDPRADAETRARTGAASLLYVPLLYGESAVGVIELASAWTAAFSDEDIETTRLLAQVIAIALHRAYTYPRPRQDVLHDALTGLGNRRAYDERIDAELARNQRYGHSFSLARLELDGLEDAGDRLGQAAADEALRQLAVILKRDTRAIDACFRIAADEFAIVMPGTSLEGARILVERCRAHLAEARLCEGMVRTSFGIVAAADESPDALAVRVSAAIAEDKARREHRRAPTNAELRAIPEPGRSPRRHGELRRQRARRARGRRRGRLPPADDRRRPPQHHGEPVRRHQRRLLRQRE